MCSSQPADLRRRKLKPSKGQPWKYWLYEKRFDMQVENPERRFHKVPFKAEG